MRTKGCRNLLPEERTKLAKELKDGATYGFLMKKYGLKSDSALRSICKDFKIDYINSPKKKDEVWEQNIELDDNGMFQITQGGSKKELFYISIQDVAVMVGMIVNKFDDMSTELFNIENGKK